MHFFAKYDFFKTLYRPNHCADFVLDLSDVAVDLIAERPLKMHTEKVVHEKEHDNNSNKGQARLRPIAKRPSIKNIALATTTTTTATLTASATTNTTPATTTLVIGIWRNLVCE